MIQKELVVENGASTSFHRIKKMTCHPPFLMMTVQVLSYATEAAYLAGAGNTWNTDVEVPIAALDGPLFEYAEHWLTTAAESPFAPGAIVLDQMVTLENAKDRTWNRMKLIRDAKEAEPFEFNGWLFDSDKVKVTGAAFAAFMAHTAGQPYSINFTLADNSVVVLNAQQMMGAGVALLSRIDAVHQIGRTLRDLIYAPETDTFEKIAAISWPVE